jgi:coatomer protein complex subunit gamma
MLSWSTLKFLDFTVPIVNLEKSLTEYQKNPTSAPFDIRTVPLTVVADAGGKKPVAQTGSKAAPASISAASPEVSRAEGSDAYASLLASIPQFANLGPLFKSSKPVELTESETEYVVNVVKHIFNDHIVLQVWLYYFALLTI